MTRYARIDNDLVAEFLETENDITTMFHPSMVWVPAPLEVEYGMRYKDGVFDAPQAVTEDRKAEITMQIMALEAGSLENRGARELHMRQIEREAQAVATSTNTIAKILAAQPYYQRLKTLDTQIAALRKQLS